MPDTGQPVARQSNPPHEQQNDERDQDDADNTDTP